MPALTVRPVPPPVPPMASVPEPRNEMVVPATEPEPVLTVPPNMEAMVPLDKVME